MPTDINDIVLIHINEAPSFFARIEAIKPDIKPEWWQVKLLVLEVPLKSIEWILRDPYIQGESFTMGGTPVRIEKIPDQEETSLEESDNPLAHVFDQLETKTGPTDSDDKGQGKVISLVDRLKQPPDDSDSDR